MSSERRPFRRLVLGALALTMLGGHAVASGCSAGFAPISEVDGLRVLATQADLPYAQPGDTVKLTMTWADSRPNAKAPTIVWVGGCFDPPGDQYYGCYSQLAGLLQGVTDPQQIAGSGLVGFGETFSLKLPEDIISRRPEPPAGTPWYGIAYVFFLACTGYLGPVDDSEGESVAGYFPIGCYDKPYSDKTKKRLGAESFVPGYTQIYAFADGRTNANPEIADMTLGDKSITGGPDNAPEVEACPISEDDRNAPGGCGRADPNKDCTTYDVAIAVPDDVAEIDPSGKQPDGSVLHETVWVDYFAEKGDFNADAKLISDAVQGVLQDFAVTYTPPPDPGPVRIWAVIHDNRGGQSVIERYLRVK